MAIDLTVLGTGSPLPDPARAGPATLVRGGEATLLVDCGRAVVMRLAAAGVVPPMLSAVLVTHLHSDHITDLGDVITTRWVMSPEPAPLAVIGPAGTGEVVDATLAALAPDISSRLAHHDDLTEAPAVEVTEVGDGDRLDLAGATVSVRATDHRPVAPTVGYRVEVAGAAVALAGDTVPCPGLEEICAGADASVHTVVREDLVRAVGNPRFTDVLDYHSTVTQAAEVAARAGVTTLVLTHCVPPPGPGDEAAWRAMAAEVFGGEVVLGGDLTSTRVGRAL